MGALASGLRIAGAENSARTPCPPRCGIYIWKTWKVGVTQSCPLRQHQRVDAVDRLRDGGDGDLVRVALEDGPA